MAGNVGTQSLAVTIRVLMDEKLSAGGQLKLILKEMKVGLANGLILGVMSFILVGAYILIAKSKGIAFFLRGFRMHRSVASGGYGNIQVLSVRRCLFFSRR